MFVIRENYGGHRQYVSTSSPHWLDLLNGTTKKKEFATKFYSKKEAEDFKAKLEEDGYDAAGSAVYDRFTVVRA